MKLATHSIFFDCDDWRDPILRIPFQSIDQVRPTRDNSRSFENETFDNSTGSNYNGMDEEGEEGDFDNSVLIVANSVTFQKELGVDHPYIDMHIKGRHIFTPMYTSSFSFLEDIMILLKIAMIDSMRLRNLKLKQYVRKRESQIPFDLTLLQHGSNENSLLDVQASSIHTICKQPGRLRITRYNIYFMPIHNNESITTSLSSLNLIPIKHINGIRKLKHGYLDSSIEFSFINNSNENRNKTLMLSFPSKGVREKILSMLYQLMESLEVVQTFSKLELELTLTKWRNGTISNYDYLLFLNLAAGRSFNDLSQYPVFPWVIQDYASSKLDLDDPNTFRDLSKPIGALNKSRFDIFLQRYHELCSNSKPSSSNSNERDSTANTKKINSPPPPSSSPPFAFFYGTHYSTPAYIINYLVRAAPAAMLKLQNGKFDTPDRLFHNIQKSWESVLKNVGDVKELIPEFYALDYSNGMSSGMMSSTSISGEFLDNVLSLELGIKQDGVRVDDVELPSWANGSSQLFVKFMSQALESDHVSNHLHAWIDLIFGIKSRSVQHSNVFFTDVAMPAGYIENNDIPEIIKDEEELERIETIFLEFGITPNQIFELPHPPRYGNLSNDARSTDSTTSTTERSVIEGCKQESLPQLSPNYDKRIHAPVYNNGRLAMNSFELNTVQQADLNSTPISEYASVSVSANDHEENGKNGDMDSGHQARKRSRPKIGYQSDNVVGVLAKVEGGVLTKKADTKIPLTVFPLSKLNVAVQNKMISENNPLETQTPVATSDSQILDMCLIVKRNREYKGNGMQNEEEEEKETDGEDEKQAVENKNHLSICCVWRNDLLKIHASHMQATLRSKFISGINCVSHIGDNIIVYGTRHGTIGVYFMNNARHQTVLEHAHEGDIESLIILNDTYVVSSSLDGSVKVWRLEQKPSTNDVTNSNRSIRLKFVVEVDAESSVKDICVFVDHDENSNVGDDPQDKNDKESPPPPSPSSSAAGNLLLLAVYTVESFVLVWRLDLADTQCPFPEPVWRHDAAPVGGELARSHLMAWLRQNGEQSTVLFCPPEVDGVDNNNGSSQPKILNMNHSLNVWDIDRDSHMAHARLYLNDSIRSICPSHATRTVLIGAQHGTISEFDSTGLCIHRIQFVEQPSVICVPGNNLDAIAGGTNADNDADIINSDVTSAPASGLPLAITQLCLCSNQRVVVMRDYFDNVYTLDYNR